MIEYAAEIHFTDESKGPGYVQKMYVRPTKVEYKNNVLKMTVEKQEWPKKHKAFIAMTRFDRTDEGISSVSMLNFKDIILTKIERTLNGETLTFE